MNVPEQPPDFSLLTVPPEHLPETHDVPGADVPEDLRVPWGGRDLLALLGVALASYVILSVVLALIFVSLGVSLQALKNPARGGAFFAVIDQVLVYGALMLYLWGAVRLRSGKPFWRSIGWRTLPPRVPKRLAYAGFIAGGCVFAVVIQAASAFERQTKLPIENFFQDRRSAIALMVMAVLAAPIVEETIFRGYIYPVIARKWGIATGVLLTGILFGLLHAPQLWGGWGHIALLVVVGIVFTYARARSGSVIASYLLHLGYNGLLFIAMVIATSGLRNFPPP